MNFLMVALGGGIGAICRYAISLIPIKSQFPFITLIVNLLGAIFIGFIVGFAESRKMSSNTSLFLKVGFCGGFTTFSTFSAQALQLLQSGHRLLGMTYILTSAIVCILMTWVGTSLTEKLIKFPTFGRTKDF